MKKYTCPCCGYKKIASDGDYDICPICFWEDDPYQKMNEYDLGANTIPLVEAQKNYIRLGACEEKATHVVRKPTEKDKKDPDWKSIDDNLYEFKLACRKFIEGTYSIAELEHNLSWVAVPDDIVGLIKQTENDLEMIRFCTSDYNRIADMLKKRDVYPFS
ncbi:hypothetical protein GC093_23645 [Paenibacillus sp. LMG 31456]|uniref:Cysteine-rich CPCC domain-containing protein n=1 Tax=Paenibacillus foliorum TaxID=2654974 RepID=A0A972H095_9BACL|nr:hypothetical protein [Paenibacillus foliorum]